MDIQYRYDLLVLEETDLNIVDIERIFSVNPDEIIYVTSNDKLTGMITLGDFIRFEFTNHELVKSNFTFLNLSETDRAAVIFQRNGTINNIPVVDAEGKLRYEVTRSDFLKKSFMQDKNTVILNEVISEQSLTEMMEVISCFGIKEIYFVEEKGVHKEILNKMSSVFNCVGFSCNKIESWEVSKKCKGEWKNRSHEIIIIDLSIAYNLYRRKLYEKYHIQYLGLFEFINCIVINPMGTHCKESFMQSIAMLTELYDTIAVYGENIIADQLIKADRARIIKVNNTDLVYDYSKKSYRLDKMEINPEIFISCNFLIRECFIESNEGKILHCPFHSLYLPTAGIADYDIAMNIYTKLVKNNIKVLLVEAPHDTPELLEDSKCIDIIDKRRKKYPANINTQSSLMNSKEYKAVLNYGEDIDKFINEMYEMKNSMQKGYPSRADFNGDFFSVFEGVRYTEGSLKNQDRNKIYMFGPCTIFGAMVKDEDTIASKLQKLLDDKYCVINHGYNSMWKNYQIRDCEYQVGDIVIIMIESSGRIYDQYNLPVYSIMEAYNNIENLNYHIWDELTHCNHIVMDSIAKVIYKLLIDNGYFKKILLEDTAGKITFRHKEGSRNNLSDQMEQWLNDKKKFAIKGITEAGCIVMNCNPFTNGHKYLVEQSAKQVEHLYIFVVEEDRSFFKFVDRLEMVRQGVKELDNVTVLPSGSYMISEMTLPGYFNKENLQDIVLDAAEDLAIFSNYIAPAFNIKIRFAGEEPNDRFTMQYNNAMSRLLPENGINFIEIPRIKSGGKFISATRVRQYLKESDYEQLRHLVPDTTYFYLLKHYNQKRGGLEY